MTPRGTAPAALARRPRPGLVGAIVFAWLALLLATAVPGALVVADLTAQERAHLAGTAAAHVPHLIVGVLLMLAGTALLMRWLHARHVQALYRLCDDAELMLTGNPAHRAAVRGAPAVDALAAALNALGAAREHLLQDVAGKVREAAARAEQERNRVLALMADFTHGVLMCTAEGRILLYNAQAMRLLSRPLASTAPGARPVPVVGLGRSVYGIFDRGVIGHALETVRARLRDGSRVPLASFVVPAPGGTLVRVEVAPVRRVGAGAAAGEALDGFVLFVDDIASRMEDEERRNALLQELTDGSRAAVASLRAAVEAMTAFPDMEAPARTRFIGIIDEEVQRLSQRLDAVGQGNPPATGSPWHLEDMRAADFVAAACRAVESRVGLPARPGAVDPSLWMRVEGYALLQVCVYLARRLRDDLGVAHIAITAGGEGGLAHVDLGWAGPPPSFETATRWQTDPLGDVPGRGAGAAPTVRTILQRHGGEMWTQAHAPPGQILRIALPSAVPQAAAAMPAAPDRSEAEYYDFDLVGYGEDSLLETPLRALSFTVFDTETTGLDPGAGDEIVSIGAVRVVNARVLGLETFDQLVRARRSMSAASQAVTGIATAMLSDQPTLPEVLPAFIAFCAESVPVGHNVAFDLAFLRPVAAAHGLVLPHPVLDTLVLSEVLHPDEPAHGLEAIAARLGVTVRRRHSALGDALTTAELFVRLLPLLEQRGIGTLGAALEASRTGRFARLAY